MRKEELITDNIYHVFTKSIAGFKVFKNSAEFSRIISVIKYYQKESPSVKFSLFVKLTADGKNYKMKTNYLRNNVNLIEIIAYCIMPTHLHLILKQSKADGISTFMNNILNSYTRYFNTRNNRKGPLWEGRFKNVLIKTEEQLLHLTRYLHLNPVTAYLVNNPIEWEYSSYKEYLLIIDTKDKICKFDDTLNVIPDSYRKFAEDGISYQRNLAIIKKLILE